MKKRNIFERAVAIQSTTPFFQKEKKKFTPQLISRIPRIASFGDLRLLSITQQLKTAIELAISENEKISILKDRITVLKAARQHSQKIMTSVDEIYRSAAKTGKPITYYEAETVALNSDLEYVITTHNIDLFSTEIEKIKQKIILRVLQQSKVFADLSQKEKKSVGSLLRAKGIFFPNFETGQVELPTNVAKKYSIQILLHAPEEDEENSNPEVLEHFEEDQARWESNGDGKIENSGGWRAQMIAADMVQAGMKVLKIYASAPMAKEIEKEKMERVMHA